MTEAEGLGSCQRLRRILTLLVRISSAISLAKDKSSQNGEVFVGWTVRINDIDHTGRIERTVSVFGSYLRISESNHDAELVMTDAEGVPVIVLSCAHLETVSVLGKGKHRSYKIVTEGATIILAA